MRALLDLVAPPSCVGCGATGDGELCEGCAHDVAVIDGPICERCGGRANPDGACACAALGGFRRARSLVAFAEPARALTLSLKRRGSASTAKGIGELLAALARRDGLAKQAGVVTYVPGGRSSVRKGFDHAELLARAVAASLGLRCRRLIVRVDDGPRQADVPMAERRRNVAERFAARRVSGGVILVDDVFTTGATAEACSLALRGAGAVSVDVLTWARTLRRAAQ